MPRIPLALPTVVLSALLLGGCAVAPEPEAVPTPTPTATATPRPTPTPTPTPTFDTARYSIDDPASLWVIVNKRRPVTPTSYAPADLVIPAVSSTDALPLRAEAASATEAMFAAAQAEAGLALQITSAYRSFESQTRIYNRTVGTLGQAGADQVSARPGHSEHQTGLAVDIGSIPAVCAFEACFGGTPHGQWLAANAHRFGFVLRYPEGLTPVTGYIYEPWHFRYVGLELAAEVQATGILTLEEFFGLPAAPDYAG